MQESFKKEGIDAGMDHILPKPLYADILMDILVTYQVINEWIIIVTFN